MKNEDFDRLSRILDKRAKLKPIPSVRPSVEDAARARAIQMGGMDAFLDHLASPEANLDQEVDLLTALAEPMAGDFFTNPAQYEYLAETVLPEWCEDRGADKELSAWVAGCSSGEEAYALAFVLSDFGESCPGFAYSLVATDCSQRMLEQAAGAVYSEEKVLPVPHRMRKKYLLRSKDRTKRLVRVAKEVRANFSFRRLNLCEEVRWLPLMDLIFCRENALPFQGPGTARIIRRLANRLADGGHVFLGREHALSGQDALLKQVAPTVYRKV